MSRGDSGIHVLIVTFGYEPLAHVSAKRPSRMARELVRQGLDVTALTVDWRRDRPAAPRDLERTVADALAAPAPRVVAVDGRLCDPAFDPLGFPRTTEPPGPRIALVRRMKTMADTVGWGPFPRWARLAFAAARRVHRAKPIDAIWAIHGDDSSHEIAYRLHQAEGIPWVADFKDPWNHFHRALAMPIQKWATARRVRSAEMLTETCAAQAADDSSEFARPVEVVYSGYEAATMAEAPTERPGDGFSAAYFGNIGAQHDPSLFAEVFGELSRRGILGRAGVRLRQFARLPGQIGGVLAGRVPASAIVEHDWVDERRAFGLMKGSDCLLILTPSAMAGRLVGVKEIESFASGTPVLHLGDVLDEMRQVVRECPQVRVARTKDEGVAAFEDILAAPRRGPVNAASLASFSWSVQGERLARVLVSAAVSGR